MRHMLAVDPHQAAEHVLNLTMALGLQPYKAQVHPDSWESLLFFVSIGLLTSILTTLLMHTAVG